MTAPKSAVSANLRRRWLTQRQRWSLFCLCAIAWALWQAETSAQIVNWGGLAQFGEFWRASLQPDLSIEFLSVIGRGTAVTLAYAICGTFFSLGVGLVGGLFSSETWWRTLLPYSHWSQGLWLFTRSLLAFPRALHELIWGLFFLNIFGLDPLVAILAIAIPFGAITAKVFSEIFDETPQAPLNNLLHSGVAPLTAWLYGLLPQALPNLLSYGTYRFECSLRSAAVLGVIGAGGLGYEILLSMQSLRYEQLWTGFYALILLTGCVDFGSTWLRGQLGFSNRLQINFPQNTSTSSTPVRKIPLLWLWVIFAIAVPTAFTVLQPDWSRLWSTRSRQLASEIMISAQPHWPTWETAQQLWRLSSLTLAMSILAIAIAGLGGMILSFPAARSFLLPGGWLRPAIQNQRQFSWGQSLLYFSRGILLIARAIPSPLWALVCLFLFFPGVWPGAIALGIHNLGILGRLLAEVNECVDDRPVRTLATTGASAGQLLFYGVLPQNIGQFLAYILYRWDVCLRETVIVGLVGAGGLGRLLTEQLSSFDYGGLTLTLGCFMLLTFAVDLVSRQLRRALRG